MRNGCRVQFSSLVRNTIRDSISRSSSVRTGPALRARLAARAASVRALARLRAAGQPSRAGLVLEEVGVRHVEQ